MAPLSPYQRIQQLLHLVALSPTHQQIVEFLSRHLNPLDEKSGVGWMVLGEEGSFETPFISGLLFKLDPGVKISLSDDNVFAECMRLGKSKIWDMAEMHAQYRDATHRENLSVYAAGLALPISNQVIIACAFRSSRSNLIVDESYFECIRLILVVWLANQSPTRKRSTRENLPQVTTLTDRQREILQLVQQGRTNPMISKELGFSESLIRQETIAIYKKLGVRGRKDLFAESEND